MKKLSEEHIKGPTFKWPDGTKSWWFNGKRHRLDGPAVEWPDGDKWWIIDGKRYTTFQSYLKAVKPLISEQVYYILLLTYGTEE